MSVPVTVAVTVEYRSNLYIGGLYSECVRDCYSDCRVTFI